jgi:hypothetical protein
VIQNCPAVSMCFQCSCGRFGFLGRGVFTGRLPSGAARNFRSSRIIFSSTLTFFAMARFDFPPLMPRSQASVA